MTLNILALAKQVEELIKNGGSGGTSDYEQLYKKPQINGHTLIGNKTAADLGITGGSDIPELTGVGKMLATHFNSDNQPEMYWEDIYNMIGANTNLYSTDESDVGKVFTKYGSGSKNIGWVNAQASYTEYLNNISGLSATNVQMALDEVAGMISGGGGGGTTEVTLFDGDVEAVSGSTGYFQKEILLADRIELCEGVHAKYKTLTIEASYVRVRPEDEKTESVNVSRTFDLERLLIGDAQTYNDPQYDTDDTAHVVLRNDDLVERLGNERYLLTTIQINQNGTDPANNVYTGKFFRVTFQYYTFNNGSTEYLPLPKEQKVRVKITVK